MNTPEAGLSDLPLSKPIAEALGRYRSQLLDATGAALVALILYGGVVRRRYQPGRSDINLMIVLKDAGVPVLDRLAPVLRAAWREIRLEPFLVVEAELERVALVFPTKLLDIQRFHRLLEGEDVLARLKIPRAELSRRIEQELRNLTIRLRRRFLSIQSDDEAMRRVLLEAATTLRINFLGMLQLANVKVAEEERTAPVYSAAADRFGLDKPALQQLSELRSTGAGAGQVRGLYGAILALVAAAADRVAQLEKSNEHL